MATIPRTYKITDSATLDTIPKKNGQVIALYDTDAVYYDAPKDGTINGPTVRRKISGVRVVDTLPDPDDPNNPQTPMEGIVYINIGDNQGTLPSGDPLYTVNVWDNDAWYVVATNKDDANVESEVDETGTKFLLVGSPENMDFGHLLKTPSVYVEDNKIYADLEGTAHYAGQAEYASEAALAYSAVRDNAEPQKPITNYLYDASSDATGNWGSTITFTLGNGTTKAVTVSDTTYKVFTADPNVPGLVNGINTTVPSDNTGVILSGSGWINVSDIVLPAADSANKDGLGQVIASTYITSGSYDVSTEELTLVYGDSTVGTPHKLIVPIPDTTYDVFDTTKNGLVPASSGVGDANKFLRGDHTWQTVIQPTDVYQGATAGNPGVSGLVPAASAGEMAKYLKGDGTWGTTFSQGVSGLVPGPSTSSNTLSLKADGTWTADIDTKNTAGATSNTNSTLFLVGATQQSSNPQTYTNDLVYIQNSKLYQSNGAVGTPSAVEVVDVSSEQDLTNKTFDGEPLGTSAFVNTTDNMNSVLSLQNSFTGTGSQTEFAFEYNQEPIEADTITEVYINSVLQDPSTYSFGTDNLSIVFTSAPANQADIDVFFTADNPDYDGDDVPTNDAVASYVPNAVQSVIGSILMSYPTSEVIAANYSDSSAYNIDDFCTNLDNGVVRLYRCKMAIPSGGENFTPSHWEVMTVMDAVKYLIAQI